MLVGLTDKLAWLHIVALSDDNKPRQDAPSTSLAWQQRRSSSYTYPTSLPWRSQAKDFPSLQLQFWGIQPYTSLARVLICMVFEYVPNDVNTGL